MPNIMPIIRSGDPILKLKAEPISNIHDPQLATLIEDMVLTMTDNPIRKGVGLAAPQIGRSIRLFVMNPFPNNPDKKAFAVINPEILSHSEVTEKREEACLSIPELAGMVPRFKAIRVKYTDRDGRTIEKRLEGFTARVFQHEYDHLDGVMFTDRVESENDVFVEAIEV